MEEGIQWYPLPEVRSPEDNWDQTNSTASRSNYKPEHTYAQKFKSEWKHSSHQTSIVPVKITHTSPSGSTCVRCQSHDPNRSCDSRPSPKPFPITCTPSEVKPSDLSISTLFTVSPNTTGNTSVNIHPLRNTFNISHHSKSTLQQHKQVAFHSRGVQSSSQRVRGGLKSISAPSSQAHPSSPTTPRLTLAELDDIWKKFLASSLVSSSQPNNENSKPTCTCGTTLRESQTRDEYYTSSGSSVKIQPTTFERHGARQKVKGDCIGSHKHRSSHKRESLLRERAVQTSPQPPAHCILPAAPPVAFSLPPDDVKTGVQISHLTLSEALAMQYPEFIERSLKRQRQLRERRREEQSLRHQDQDRPTPVGGTAHPVSYQSIASGHHPKVSMKEMYRASKKAWEQLPEVRAKVKEEKRKSQATTNRLRAKLYQQEVLSRLRRKRKRYNNRK